MFTMLERAEEPRVAGIRPPNDSYDRPLDVPTSNTAYTRKCRSELCRNCVTSPRKHPQTPTFTGSHQEAFCGGKSLRRLPAGKVLYHSMRPPRTAFPTTPLNH